jgi:hypothetical protein
MSIVCIAVGVTVSSIDIRVVESRAESCCGVIGDRRRRRLRLRRRRRRRLRSGSFASFLLRFLFEFRLIGDKTRAMHRNRNNVKMRKRVVNKRNNVTSGRSTW